MQYGFKTLALAAVLHPKDLCCVYPYLCDIRRVVDAAPITIALARRGHTAATRSVVANAATAMTRITNSSSGDDDMRRACVCMPLCYCRPCTGPRQPCFVAARSRRFSVRWGIEARRRRDRQHRNGSREHRPLTRLPHGVRCVAFEAQWLGARRPALHSGSVRCGRLTLAACRLQVAALTIFSGAIQLANSRIGISVRGTCAPALAPSVATGGSCCRGPCWTPTAPAAATSTCTAAASHSPAEAWDQACCWEATPPWTSAAPPCVA